MADSIKIIFNYDQEMDDFLLAQPSYEEIIAFFQDIIHVITPEEMSAGPDFVASLPHYNTSVHAIDAFGPAEVTYSVVDLSQFQEDPGITIFATNYWDYLNPQNRPEIPPNDFIYYSLTTDSSLGEVYIDSFQTNPPGADEADTIEFTFYKDGGGSDSNAVPEPEVYPSVARSLDKIVDKMEGNEVTYKEAVPSIEYSLHKIAELYEESGNNGISPVVPTGNTYVDWDMIENKPSINAGNGTKSIVEGYGTTATGAYSHAEGYGTSATGAYSHAEGGDTTEASGDYSHAEGRNTTAELHNSHAEGRNTISRGVDSHAEGYGSMSSGSDSHAEGFNTVSSGNNSHAEGRQTESSGLNSHAEGYKSKATNDHAHAEGWQTTSSGTASHSEGDNTIASSNYSHAEGQGTHATNTGAHSEGYNSIASGQYSHAEGFSSEASGSDSHAEGYDTQAIGSYSHSEGYKSTAKGAYSHAEGLATVAKGDGCHVFGIANIEETLPTGSTKGRYVEIVGNGSYASGANMVETYSNARTLDWDGNEWLAGNITLGNTTLTENDLIALLALIQNN